MLGDKIVYDPECFSDESYREMVLEHVEKMYKGFPELRDEKYVIEVYDTVDGSKIYTHLVFTDTEWDEVMFHLKITVAC